MFTASPGRPLSLALNRVTPPLPAQQVWSSSKEVLCRRLGAQTGAALWQHAHGIDERPVAPPKARRTVGAEVNWGVRFSTQQEADTFLKVGMGLGVGVVGVGVGGC
jgi:nucleotidyltransferase/DNA polymerase involved in DNA repair